MFLLTTRNLLWILALMVILTGSPQGASCDSSTPALTSSSGSYPYPSDVVLTMTLILRGQVPTSVGIFQGAAQLWATSQTHYNNTPYTYTVKNLTPGNYSFTGKAWWCCSMPATVSAPLNISITVPNPSVSLTSPSNNASYIVPGSIVLTASASTGYGSISKVEFYNGGTLLGTDFSSPYTYTWNSVAAGNYSLTAKAYGSNGNVGTSAAVNAGVYTKPPFVTFDTTCVNKLPK